MAPTAAMLTLCYHNSYKPSSSSSPTFPSCSRPHAIAAAAAAASSLVVKVSAAKWVSQGYAIFKGRTEGKESSAVVDLDSSSFALEKSFEEALQLSCW